MALVVVGVDGPVADVVAQVPATGREPAPADPDGRLFEALRGTLVGGEIVGGPEDTIGLSVVSADPIHAPDRALTAAFPVGGGRDVMSPSSWEQFCSLDESSGFVLSGK